MSKRPLSITSLTARMSLAAVRPKPPIRALRFERLESIGNAAAAQYLLRRDGARSVPMTDMVVELQEIDPVKAQALEALLETARNRTGDIGMVLGGDDELRRDDAAAA